MALQLDPVSFRLSFQAEEASSIQRANAELANWITAEQLGPTLASRAFALLNTAAFDLWAAVDPIAVPRFGLDGLDDLPLSHLDQAVDHLADSLFEHWFSGFSSSSPAPLDSTGWDGLIASLVSALPELDPWSGLDLGAQVPETTRSIDHWTPEHIPIDDADAPLESFLTPFWGSLEPFSISDVSQWRQPGPEPFLLLDSSLAQLHLESGEIELRQPWVDTAGVLHDPGFYAIGSEEHQAWLLQGAINPTFVSQAQELVDLQINLSDEQKLIAEFWEDGGGTPFPPGSWMAITALVAEQESLDLIEQIQLFFAVGQAVGDAGIAAWDNKAHFDYARPVRVIRDLSALDLLTGENLDQWNSYQLPGSHSSPPFPEYVSGHSSFSNAAATVLQQFVGHDQLNLSIMIPAGGSRFEPGVTPFQDTTLYWETFADAAQAAGDSRLFGGIHFADGNDDGLKLGQLVGDQVWSTAQQLTYAGSGDVLSHPIGLENRFDIHPENLLLIDGHPLPSTLERVQLARGADQISVGLGASWGGSLDAGSGFDQLIYDQGHPRVSLNLARGEATGFSELWGVEQVQATAQNDVLIGSSASDWFQGNGGDDSITGSGGFDVAIFRGNRTDYSFVGNQVIDLRDSGLTDFDGSDTLQGVEQFQFADGSWGVNELFPLRQARLELSLVSPGVVVYEGQDILFEIHRDGDLTDALDVQLAWQSRRGSELAWSDFSASAFWPIHLPAGEQVVAVQLPALRDGLLEGIERGYLQIDSVRHQPDLSPLTSLQLEWSSDPVVVQVHDPENSGLFDQPFQTISSSPLPLWVQPGSTFDVPLRYSVSDGVDELSGISFQLEPLPAGLRYIGFEPSTEALTNADLWAASLQDNGAVSLSFLSVDGKWPGSHGQLPLPLGVFELSADLDFSTASIAHSPVQLSGQSSSVGYQFSIDQPQLSFLEGWSLDVDGDGEVRPFSDGLLVMRHLLGLRGASLVRHILPSSASRTPEQVDAWITHGIDQGLLDFDGDGRTTPFSDGLLLLRFSLGMTDEQLLDKAISPQSPFLEGLPFQALSASDLGWVSDQVQARIDALS